jgi:hypothetical protein
LNKPILVFFSKNKFISKNLKTNKFKPKDIIECEEKLLEDFPKRSLIKKHKPKKEKPLKKNEKIEK